MAAVSGVVQYSIIDADSEPDSIDVPFTTSTGLLADIVAFINALTPAVDLVIDGQIIKITLKLKIPLPGGLKSAPASGAENERTGLFTMLATGTPNAYGLDLASFSSIYFTGNAINTANANVAALIAILTGTTSSTKITDRYGNDLASVKTAYKTFRKKRKALRRA